MRHRRLTSFLHVLVLLMITTLAWACVRRTPPVTPAPATPPPAATSPTTPPPAPPPAPRAERPPVPPAAEDDFASRSLEDLNRELPLAAAFFGYDSAQIDEAARVVLDANAAVLRQYPTLIVTIEGHCDERGTPEYNLSLGERRALAARDYLVGLGLAATRLRTVSYGKEFPFDGGHTEDAWSSNRRAHFVITAK
jgi:peptidoglycan-associated lipoprotein